MTKREALEIINDRIGRTILRHSNTAYSGKLHDGNIWWTGMRPIKLQEDFYLVLLDDAEQNPKLILIELPANTIRHPSKVFRTNMSGINRGRTQIWISNDQGSYLRDVVNGRLGFDFQPYKTLEVIV